VVPRSQRLLGVGMFFPELSERAAGYNPHCGQCNVLPLWEQDISCSESVSWWSKPPPRKSDP
jgi:hypothetical protein